MFALQIFAHFRVAAAANSFQMAPNNCIQVEFVDEFIFFNKKYIS